MPKPPKRRSRGLIIAGLLVALPLLAGFLESRGLDVPVLVDVDGSFFAGMHSPGLPSTVVISPDGTLAYFHTGVTDDLADRLRAEATALLEEQ